MFHSPIFDVRSQFHFRFVLIGERRQEETKNGDMMVTSESSIIKPATDKASYQLASSESGTNLLDIVGSKEKAPTKQEEKSTDKPGFKQEAKAEEKSTAKPEAKAGNGKDTPQKPDVTSDGSDKKSDTSSIKLRPELEKELETKLSEYDEYLKTNNFDISFKKGEGPWNAINRLRESALKKAKSGEKLTAKEKAFSNVSHDDMLTEARRMRDRDFKVLKDDNDKPRNWYIVDEKSTRWSAEEISKMKSAKEKELRKALEQRQKDLEKKEKEKEKTPPGKPDTDADDSPKAVTKETPVQNDKKGQTFSFDTGGKSSSLPKLHIVDPEFKPREEQTKVPADLPPGEKKDTTIKPKEVDETREIPRTGDRITDSVNSIVDIPDKHQQMVVVTTQTKRSGTGELRIYERHSDKGWVDTGKRIPINVGHKGLNWGVNNGGMLENNDIADARKREGDKTGPIGMFTIPGAFGLKDQNGIKRQLVGRDADPNDILPYRQIKEGSQWVSTRGNYNRWIDGGRHSVKEDLHKIAKSGLYEYGLVLGYNGADMFNGQSTTGYPVGDAKYKGGSAIFVHVERGPGRTTAGCTSMSRQNMIDLMAALKNSSNPLWLQVPKSELHKLEGRRFRSS